MRAWLLREGVDLEERDFFKDPLSEEELRGLLQGARVSDVFSWNSPSFKKMGLDRDALSDDRLIAMMLEEPRLIRRPLVLVDGNLVQGRDKAGLSRALGLG